MKMIRLKLDELRAWRENKDNARKTIAEKYTKLHGDVMLKRPNGSTLVTIRDPANHLPDPRLMNVTPPDKCFCQKWQGNHPKEGAHHKTCMNRGPWEKFLKEEAEAKPEDRVPKAPPVLHPLDKCHCKTWKKPFDADPSQHHPQCQFAGLFKKEKARYDEWFKEWGDPEALKKKQEHFEKQQEQRSALRERNLPTGVELPPKPVLESEPTVPTLFDLSTGKHLRKAFSEEIDEAKKSLEETGTSVVKVDGIEYGVTGFVDEPKEQPSP